MPIDYSKYPKNWKTEIRPRILERANHHCEECGVENHDIGYRDKGGVFHSAEDLSFGESEAMAIDGVKFIKIVLTISHTNHDITDNDDSNLRALCQKCHLNHDKDHHRKTRLRNKYKNQPELGI